MHASDRDSGRAGDPASHYPARERRDPGNTLYVQCNYHNTDGDVDDMMVDACIDRAWRQDRIIEDARNRPKHKDQMGNIEAMLQFRRRDNILARRIAGK